MVGFHLAVLERREDREIFRLYVNHVSGTLYLDVHNSSQESALPWRPPHTSDRSHSSDSQLSSSGSSHCSASRTANPVSMRSTGPLQGDTTHFRELERLFFPTLGPYHVRSHECGHQVNEALVERVGSREEALAVQGLQGSQDLHGRPACVQTPQQLQGEVLWRKVPYVEGGGAVEHTEDRRSGLGPLQRDHRLPSGTAPPLGHGPLVADLMQPDAAVPTAHLE
ncbi:hypothetical protein EYF80_019067 [Liparis tanakae]|uniref:Uncharacterized protein n=1 Tax=Liparis tanakae TaxID=230148 RepID=A0A4Z2I0I2_9TELE|nr:hypothetical protein EYF80_019067 [Liparis tanakae]